MAAPRPNCWRSPSGCRFRSASSASGLGAMPSEHPLALGLVSRGGVYHANHAARQADVLLALGVRFDDRTSSSWLPGYSFTIPPTKLIHVDIDPDEIARNYPVALGLMADVRTFLRQVLAELDARKDIGAHADARKKWLDAIAGYRKEWDALVAPGFTDDATPDQSAARRLRDRPRAARRRDPRQRHRRASQLAAAILQAEAAGFADRLDGLRPDGLRRRRRARRQARRARPAVRRGGRRRRLLHACERARHRGRIRACRSSGWCGTTTPMRRSAACSAAISAAASSRPTSSIRRPARPTIPTSPRWRARPASRACTIDRAGDLADAVRAGIASGKPYLIDANIGADKNPGGAGVWELPGHGQRAGDRRPLSGTLVLRRPRGSGDPEHRWEAIRSRCAWAPAYAGATLHPPSCLLDAPLARGMTVAVTESVMT